MWIVRLALARPYTFVVAALVLLLLTPFVLLRTPTDIFPEINIPVVSVVWVYNGLSAQEVEPRIVYNHERMITALVNDIEHIESTILLSALGETVNLMTLGGLALAVGILVDDATVEIENVHRQMALGKPNVQAILDGAQEIALPAFVSTLCICIVFVPMFFLTGVARYLFVPLAEAVVFAMLASYALSRTLIPTLVMWFYRNIEYRGHLADAATVSLWLRPFVAMGNRFERGFIRFRGGYRKLLGSLLAHRAVFVILSLAFCAGTWLLVPQLGQDFFPTVDAGHFRLHVRLQRDAHRGTTAGSGAAGHST